jgi:hypothetical protein
MSLIPNWAHLPFLARPCFFRDCFNREEDDCYDYTQWHTDLHAPRKGIELQCIHGN